MSILQTLRVSLVMLSILGCIQTTARQGEFNLLPRIGLSEDTPELREHSAVADACTVGLADKADLRAGYDPKAGLGFFLRF